MSVNMQIPLFNLFPQQMVDHWDIPDLSQNHIISFYFLSRRILVRWCTQRLVFQRQRQCLCQPAVSQKEKWKEREANQSERKEQPHKPRSYTSLKPSPLGRGPRQKNGKILTKLSFFAVFNHKNCLEKVWKSRNEFKLVGFKVEKNGPCSRENEVKYQQKTQNGQKWLFPCNFYG